MDYSLDIDSLTLRMLGYYNKEGQSLNDEKEEIELANELAKRLKASFDNTKDVNNNEEFKNAKENGVFIFRDKYSNLYAYWHKEQIARITNVVYSNKDIKPLPFEYKSWFTPGDEIVTKAIKDEQHKRYYISTPGSDFLITDKKAPAAAIFHTVKGANSTVPPCF